jgi:phage shock protein A
VERPKKGNFRVQSHLASKLSWLQPHRNRARESVEQHLREAQEDKAELKKNLGKVTGDKEQFEQTLKDVEEGESEG